MTTGYPLTSALLLAAARTADPAVVLELARSVVPELTFPDVPVRAILHRLCERGDPVVATLRLMLPHLDATMELGLAKMPDLPDPIAVELAGSRRKNTLMALAERDRLPAAAAQVLLRCRHPQVREQVLYASGATTQDRLGAYTAREVTAPARLCDLDRVFCTRVLTDRFERLRTRLENQPGTSTDPAPAITDDPVEDSLELMPHHDLDETLSALLYDWVQLCAWHARRQTILAYLCRALDAGALATVLAALAGLPDGERRKFDVSVLRTRVVSPVPAIKKMRARVWSDEATVESAYRHGGQAQIAALRHPGLPAPLREAAVYGASSTARLAVASNPALTSDEAGHLLQVLPARKYVELAMATLTVEQREQVIAGCARGVTVLITGAAQSVTLPQWLGPWLQRPVLRALLRRRAGGGPEAADGPEFLELAELTLRRFPDLAADVAAAVQPGDQLSPRVADAILAPLLASLIVPAAASTLQPGETGLRDGSGPLHKVEAPGEGEPAGRVDEENLCAVLQLLPDWDSSVADLVEAVLLISREPDRLPQNPRP